MYRIKSSSAFKKHYKSLEKSYPRVRARLKIFVDAKQSHTPLPLPFRDHALKGDYDGCRECHLFPDVLLIYKISDNVLELLMIDIGSHSDLFG